MVYNIRMTRKKNHTYYMAIKYLKNMIFSVAKIELPTLTLLDTQSVIENLDTDKLDHFDREIILGIKKAWQEIIVNDDKLDIQYVKNINRVVAKGQIERAGSIRTGAVIIKGTSYVPPEVTEEDLIKLIDKVNTIEDKREAAAYFLGKSTKAQYFGDGNKRTSLIVANKILLDGEEGLIDLELVRGRYFKSLISYYEDESKLSEFKDFVKSRIFKSAEELLQFEGKEYIRLMKTPEEKEVISLAHGLDGNKIHQPSEISEKLNIPESDIRKIRSKAILRSYGKSDIESGRIKSLEKPLKEINLKTKNQKNKGLGL